ncbi:hypothetical protein K2W90_07025 [Candidatus Babeliales bacterium]|nr:hypothetical protein [Candidatus Babeliales bacterium]
MRSIFLFLSLSLSLATPALHSAASPCEQQTSDCKTLILKSTATIINFHNQCLSHIEFENLVNLIKYFIETEEMPAKLLPKISIGPSFSYDEFNALPELSQKSVMRFNQKSTEDFFDALSNIKSIFVTLKKRIKNAQSIQKEEKTWLQKVTTKIINTATTILTGYETAINELMQEKFAK